MWLRFLATVFTALSLTAPVWSQAQPSGGPRTVQDGVFTPAQSERGRHQYDTYCGRCHGEDLTGANARALVGEDFLRNWTGLALDGLLERAQSMPPGAAGSLGTEAYVDIVTYVLDKNGFPSGEAELVADALPTVVVEGADGPQEVPNHTLVQVVGCLTTGPDQNWMVTDATDPVRTRDPAASVDAAQALVDTVGLGGGTYQLLYVFPAPDALVGHTVEAKGFLIRGDLDSLNVTALTSVSPGCVR